jgi:hypothetical protein
MHHPLDGITNHKYKMLHFLTTKFFCNDKKTLAFNRDRCCHLVLYHWNYAQIILPALFAIRGYSIRIQSFD